jgi:RNA-directed DNA polymerase
VLARRSGSYQARQASAAHNPALRIGVDSFTAAQQCALSVLDEYIARAPGGPHATPYQRVKRRRLGLPNYRLIRYADDWVLAISGTRAHAEALREEIAEVLSGRGLRLSPEKTLITHIDEGLDFLGWRIQRHRKRGTSKHYVYVYPAKKALHAIMTKVKAACWC